MLEGDTAQETATIADVVHELRRLRRAIAGSQAELLSAPQAAAMLGLSTATLYRLVASGKLPPGIRVGGGRRWKRTDLTEWIGRQ